MSEQEIYAAIREKLTVPLWPHTGMALNLSRNSTYAAAHRGQIPVIKMGSVNRVSTAYLRKLLGIEAAGIEAPTGKAA